MAEYVVDLNGVETKEVVTDDDRFMALWGLPVRERIVRCRDCKNGHITIDGESCKFCDLIATHDIDGSEPNNGYDPEPYFDADFFCAFGEPKEVDA